jgi:hypothetical protein
MKNTSMTLLSVVALAILMACGGGGNAPVDESAAAAPLAGTAAGAATAPARDTATANVLPTQGTLHEDPGSVAYPAIDPSLVFRVHAELDQIEQVLRRADDDQAETREALEVISDARAELKKDRPNKLRLRSLLAGLARDVQVVDGMKAPSEFLGRLAPLI